MNIEYVWPNCPNEKCTLKWKGNLYKPIFRSTNLMKTVRQQMVAVLHVKAIWKWREKKELSKEDK